MPRVFVVLAIACAHPQPPRAIEHDIDVGDDIVVHAPDAGPIDLLAAPSVVLTANAPVRAEPSAASARIGIVGRDTRTKALDARPGAEGCDARWIAIAPRGWVCETNLAASTEPPSEPAPIALDDTTAPELGTYGAIHDAWIYDSRADADADEGHPADGGIIVHSTGVADIRGRRYVVASDGSLIASGSVAALSPSSFHGVPLAGSLDVGWTFRDTAVRASPGGAVTGSLPARSQVTIRDRSHGLVRVGDNAWVARADLRVPALAKPPDGTGEHDRWFDVDLAEQVLVAYEGTRPVYATLVSTGRPAHRTEPALARVALKLRQTTMTNSGADESYSVADVPWVMYYGDMLALHGAYWHDKFGSVHSHGCVNLAPRDARILYDWSAPDVPPGWIGVYANADTPGSVVRIH